MRRGLLAILLLTILFTAAAGYGLLEEWQWGPAPELTAEVTANGKTEEITCWGTEWGTYYIFLPSYADLSQVRLRTHTFRTVKLNKEAVPDGMTCENIELGKEYGLVYNGEDYYPITFLRSGNVPTMYIDTASGSMDYIHEMKGNEEAGVMRLYDADGTLTHTAVLDSIKGRGNATWLRSKKPYSLTLSAPEELLGMEEGTRWILLTNVYDYSHMRNKLAYDLAHDIGLSFSPDSRWTDLYLNGEYAGLYLLCERNEVHPSRVDIPKEDSFLISMELQSRLEEQNYPFVLTQGGISFRIHHAGMDNDQIRQLLQSVENALLAKDGMDPITGERWDQLIDVDSWVRKYLIEELFANFDAGSVSQYFYYNGDGKLYAGPVWDFDNTLASQEWQNSCPQVLLAGRKYIYDLTTSHWLSNLFAKEPFSQAVHTIYREEVRPMLDAWFESHCDLYSSQITQAAEINSYRSYARDPVAELERLKDFWKERIAFLDSLWIREEPYCMVYVSSGTGSWSRFAVHPGEVLTHLPPSEHPEGKTFLGWFDAFTQEPFDITQPICKDAVIQMKWK